VRNVKIIQNCEGIDRDRRSKRKRRLPKGQYRAAELRFLESIEG
jgi:hypothetical protein